MKFEDETGHYDIPDQCHQKRECKEAIFYFFGDRLVKSIKPCDTWGCPDCQPHKVTAITQDCKEKWDKSNPLSYIHFAIKENTPHHNFAQDLRLPSEWRKIIFPFNNTIIFAPEPFLSSSRIRVESLNREILTCIASFNSIPSEVSNSRFYNKKWSKRLSPIENTKADSLLLQLEANPILSTALQLMEVIRDTSRAYADLRAKVYYRHPEWLQVEWKKAADTDKIILLEILQERDGIRLFRLGRVLITVFIEDRAERRRDMEILFHAEAQYKKWKEIE